MKRRCVITAIGSAFPALTAGCGSNVNNEAAEENNSATTIQNTQSNNTNSTSTSHGETTEISTPTESADSFEYIRATDAELTVQENISVRTHDDVAEYDQEAGTVTMEGDMTITVPLEEFLGKVVGHSQAASPVCDRYEDVVTEYTELSTGRMCGTSRRDDQNIIVGDVYESDSETLQADVVETLPKTVHVTLSVEETETEYTFEYLVYVKVGPEFQLE